jgi:MFS family permease
LIAGRVLNGVTVGITSSQVPVYLAEISRKEKRGSLVIIQQLAIGASEPPSTVGVR